VKVATAIGSPGYRSDPRTGCKVWFDYPWKGETASWTGSCRDGYAEGPGVAEGHVEGSATHRYVGEMRGGQPHGWGRRYAMTADESIEGEWQDGKQEGWLVAYAVADEIRYQGQGRDGQPHGWGTDGEYEGDYREGARYGKGILRLKEGTYAGDFVEGYPDGQGTFTTTKGGVYSGSWSHGCFRQGRRWATVTRNPARCGIDWKSPPGLEKGAEPTVTSGG